jgi:O-antigen/teichoic acid export membrane protein
VGDSAPTPPVREGGAARNTLLALLTQLATAAFTAGLTVFLVRQLEPREFGLLSLAVSIGALLLLPSDFGISTATARFLAEKRGDWPAVTSLLADGLRLKIAISLVVSGALFAGAGLVADAYGEPSLLWPIRWMAIAIMGQSLLAFYRYAFLALRDASVGLRLVVGESAMEAGATVALVLTAGGAAAASAGRAAGYVFAAILAVAVTLRRFGPAALRPRGRLGDAGRRVARYAGALFAIDAAFAVSVQTAPLMIAGFLGPREVGLFAAPARLLVAVQYMGLSIANGVAPRLARSETEEPDVRTFTAALRYLILFQALVIAPLVVWAEPIVHLVLGDAYERSAELLQLLAPFIFLSGFSALLAAGVNYLGAARRRLVISIADLVLVTTMLAILLPTVGLNGAAVSSDVAAVMYVGLHLWVLQQLIDLPLRPLVLAAARGLLGAAAAAGVLALFGTSELAAWEWVAGGGAALAAFLAVVVATGELRIGELRALTATLRARGRARGRGDA